MNNHPLEGLRPLFEEGAGSVVVFDLEWNQNSYAPNLRMPHEIIEIGACRLDAQGNVEATFSEVVKPRLYRRLDKHIRQVTGITEQELAGGKPFEEAIADFVRFCGDAPQMITWGRDDFPVMKRNLNYYAQPPFFSPPLDAQLVFGYAKFGDVHRQVNLHAAMELTDTVLEVPAHRAVYDAECTAALLPCVSAALMELEASKREKLPAILERERRIADSIHFQQLTRYTQHTDALKDDAVTLLRCPVCGGRTQWDTPWFDNGRDRYEAVGVCPKHGRALGQMHLKKDTYGRLTVHQRIYRCSQEEAEDVRRAYSLFLMTPSQKRHHRLCMEEVRAKKENRPAPPKAAK